MTKKRVTNIEIMEKMESYDEYRERLEEKIDDIHECIYGNSEPEHGILWRLTQVEKVFKNVSRVTWIAIGGVVLGVIGIWMNSL